MMENTAYLSNDGDMTIFEYGDQCIKFRSPYSLERYIEIKTWENGYIEVMTAYRNIGEVEEYIDLTPILENLYINPKSFLSNIRNVKIK